MGYKFRININTNINTKFITKFYCYETLLIYLHLMGGCFSTVTSELSSCDREHKTCEARNTDHLAFYRKFTDAAVGQRYSTACPDHFPVGRFRGVSWVQRACSKVVPRPRAPSEGRALGQDSIASADLCGGLWDTLVVVPQQMPKYKSKRTEE